MSWYVYMISWIFTLQNMINFILSTSFKLADLILSLRQYEYQTYYI